MSARPFVGVTTKTDLGDAFLALRRAAAEATTNAALEAVHRRAAALVAMARSEEGTRRFDAEADEARALTEREFARTAQAVNQRARALGLAAIFAEVP